MNGHSCISISYIKNRKCNLPTPSYCLFIKKLFISYSELKVTPKLFYSLLLLNWSTRKTIYNSVSGEKKTGSFKR